MRINEVFDHSVTDHVKAGIQLIGGYTIAPCRNAGLLGIRLRHYDFKSPAEFDDTLSPNGRT